MSPHPPQGFHPVQHIFDEWKRRIHRVLSLGGGLLFLLHSLPDESVHVTGRRFADRVHFVENPHLHRNVIAFSQGHSHRLQGLFILHLEHHLSLQHRQCHVLQVVVYEVLQVQT